MKKYKIYWKRIQRGEHLDYIRESIIESKIEPKIGQGRMLLVEPPIREYISKVEIINEKS